MILHTTFLAALVGALLIALFPARYARLLALLSTIYSLGFAVLAFLLIRGNGFQFVTRIPWIAEPRIEFFTGADGISAVMLLLTGLIAVCGVLFSWNVQREPRAFFVLYLLIVAGAFGVFQSLDLFLMFVFYELVIVPKYLLIAGWGSTNREYGAMKLAMYSVGASALVLIGMVAIYVHTGTFDLTRLAAGDLFPAAAQMWLFPLVFVGFGVLAGLWPLHTWAPTGHVAAPTAVSMLLAGVVMKLGSYAALRVAMPAFPDGLEAWRLPFAILACAGILFGALTALAQRDLKFVVGYSSVSHMGFVMLGLMTANIAGLSGAVLQMFSHGIIGGLLFAIVGRLIYDRTHTRQLADLEKLGLGRVLPFAATAFTLASLASMGLPGFSGFIAELSVLAGTWRAFPWLLIPAGLGIVFTVAFTLRTLQRVFFPAEDPTGSPPPMDRISLPEHLGVAILVATTLFVGLRPSILLNPITAALRGTL